MSKISNVISRLDLVQNINNTGMLKVSGEDINFAKPVDEFSRYLIAEIPNLYRYLKLLSRTQSPELIEDVKTYLEHFENLGMTYLEESDCKKLA